MIKNFFKVNRMLYRGSAPTPDDVVKLHKDLGIKKIISLDLQSGKNIQAICKELGIAHILIPVWGTDLEVISKFINANLMDLLMKAGPTFIHCLHGKDRTGMIIAMFRCKCQGWTYDEAIKEAKSFGFGTGLEPFVKRVYETAIKMCCEKEDDNSSLDSSMDSIVNNVSNEGAAFYENLNSINTFGDPHILRRI
jgi:protein tyrosine/serine phosphatase